MEELAKKINLIKCINGISFEMDLDERTDLNLVKLGYHFVSTEPTLDLSLNFGKYFTNPAWTFPFPNAKKLKITVEIMTSDNDF